MVGWVPPPKILVAPSPHSPTWIDAHVYKAIMLFLNFQIVNAVVND